jgi:NAD(P)-dependent dehydrogenase (short-subunit alcohol dehydrogenase family)
MDANGSTPWSLAGRTVVVTGASSGIGVGIARWLGRSGARLVLVGRDAERLDACGGAVRESGAACALVEADLVDPATPDRVVQATLEAFGSLDGLVNNAGIFTYKPLAETPPEELDELYRVNVRAPYALVRAAAPHLPERGSVVFVSSNLAQVALPHTAAYAATKGAVDALARSLAVELAPRRIRVNVVAPGFVRTPMTWRLEDPAAHDAVIATIPAQRLGEVDDIGAAVAYLVSGAADYITGAVLTVDGGHSIA